MVFSATLLLLSLPALTIARLPKDVFVAGQPLKREVAAAAATTTVTKTVTSVSTLTRCSATSAATPRTSTSSTAAAVPSATDENGAVQRGTAWDVPGVGLFKNKKTFAFSGTSLPDGLYASDYTVQDTTYFTTDQIPYNHKFEPGNVQIANGVLSLTVPGGQTPMSPTKNKPMGTPIRCGEIVTTECNIQYATVRTRAIFSKEPGTCHGLFLYKSETQETDIEYLTDPASAANNGDSAPIPIWYSNQATVAGNDPTHESLNAPPGKNPTESVHEYRIDWLPSYTAFFIDGVEQTRLTENVPTEPGSWVFNNWANGDPGRLLQSHS
jgi:Glycosyl hydrolases family 16